MPTEDAVTDAPVVKLEGVFDGLVARRVEAMLAGAEPGVRLHLDLTQIREFHDFGVAVLANALKRCRASVSLRGLRLHQIRLLRYFGVEAAPLGRIALSDAA
jgi:hypothetical protein